MEVNELKFLKFKTKQHPTTDLVLEYLDHHSAVSVMLLDEKQEKTLLVKQFRPGKNGLLLEIPAGLIDPGEDSITAMYRELREETGFSKCDVELIYKYPQTLLTSPGYTTEKMDVFICRLRNNSVIPKELDLDDTEDILTEWVEIEKLEEITDDMKTIFALNLYYRIKK